MQYEGAIQKKDISGQRTAASPLQEAAGRNAVILTDNRPKTGVQQNSFQPLPQESRPVIQNKNQTGLPDQLKSGIENLSGLSLDDVKVHYQSPQPAQLNAHAFAQGNQIHVAPGQEKHLPHEAWHVVQQKQGRVRPTIQLKDQVSINDDSVLEKEADSMGAKALATGRQNSLLWLPPSGIIQYKAVIHQAPGLVLPNAVFQRFEGSSLIKPGLSDIAVIQLAHYNRLVTDPFFQDRRKTIQYFAGWFLELADLASRGALFDFISVLGSVIRGKSWPGAMEDAGRFLMQHPELLSTMGLSIESFLAEKFSLESWSVNLVMAILSRGALSDAIGGHVVGSLPEAITNLAFSMLSGSPWIGFFTPFIMAGIQRRIGRSLINRGLVFIFSIAGGVAGGIAHTIGGTAGGIVGGAVGGALGGATVGALAGATLGGLAGPAGAAVGVTTGAMIGGAVGTIAGALGGMVEGTQIGEGIKSATNMASRWWHGLSVTEGTTGAGGDKLATMPNPYLNPMPMERLHIVPRERSGLINTENAVYGSAATNSMMMPNDASITKRKLNAGKPVAIRTQGNMAEAMGMWGGWFNGRGIRTREGFLENIVNNYFGFA